MHIARGALPSHFLGQRAELAWRSFLLTQTLAVRTSGKWIERQTGRRCGPISKMCTWQPATAPTTYIDSSRDWCHQSEVKSLLLMHRDAFEQNCAPYSQAAPRELFLFWLCLSAKLLAGGLNCLNTNASNSSLKKYRQPSSVVQYKNYRYQIQLKQTCTFSNA